MPKPRATTKKSKLTLEDQLRLEAAQEQAALQTIPPLDILQEAMPYQLDFIKDPSLRKCVCSERRGGKTSALALALTDQCVTTPNSKCVYMSLTNDSCKRIVWTGILQPLFLQYNITASLNSKLEIVFPNGSIIYLVGLDATPKQMDRVRGVAFDLAVIDEAQDFTQDLKQIIQGVLKMTLAQRQAQLIMAGTPGNKQGLHYWWLINKPDTEEKEWVKYKFRWKDNTKKDPQSGLRICDAIQAMVDEDLKKTPELILDPTFRQEILGEWVIETSARIYRYEPEINDIAEPPSPAFLRDATYALGFDLGFHPDPTALVIGCWNTNYDGYIYILKAEEHHKMITQNLAARIKQLDSEYKFSYIVGDSANLNVVEDMRQTYSIPCIRADKLGKLAHQNMINSDFITKHIKLYKPQTQILSQQLQTVIWDKKSLLLGKHIEDGKYDNHCTDSLLYLHYFSRHHWYQAKPVQRPLTHQEHYSKLTEILIQKNVDNEYHIDFSEPNG